MRPWALLGVLGLVLLSPLAAAEPVRILEPGHFLYFTLEAERAGEGFAATARVEAGAPVRLVVVDEPGFSAFKSGLQYRAVLEWPATKAFDARFVVPAPGTYYAIVDHVERGAEGRLPAQFASLAAYRVDAAGARSPLAPRAADPFSAHFPLADGLEMTWLSLAFLVVSLAVLPWRSGVAMLWTAGLVAASFVASDVQAGRGVVVQLGFVIAAIVLAAHHVRGKTGSRALALRVAFAGGFVGLFFGGDVFHILLAPWATAQAAAVGGFLVIGGDGLADGIVAGPLAALAIAAVDVGVDAVLARREAKKVSA